ncbi:uncharacterized protein LOC107632878 [Arachis ipaensis]|uniref:uncharacterized protein LOC107632878 n=1 Tax=Arachis ipaensis TaxID=130454 RepID=UPI0007AEFB89|nr:uncharacterized protein LOC107632878 [Arachis ipaensis]XP_025638243.1 uncharacterized protein LOC112733492 [Arachis hypogaea]
MTRFTKVAINIPDLHPEVHLHAIKSRLRPRKFQETIAVGKPKTLAEFREKAKGQINIEELRQARKSDKIYYRDKDKTPSTKKNFKLTTRFDSYTQFNIKRDDIIKEILNSKLIKPPRKAGTYQDTKNVDKSKYSAFHQKHGHTTDDCVVAKDLLERLARQGHLDKYIGGGYASGGQSNSARKRSFRAICSVDGPQRNTEAANQLPQVTFTHADFNSSIQNLDDPVFITLQLGDLLVRKVLLDPGSSANVLFCSTFQKMKLIDNILQSTGGDLVGFSGERVPILGSVWLQTTLVHMCVKFSLQDDQVVTIHGDHKESRQCYNISMKFPNRSKQQVNNVDLGTSNSALADLDPRADFLERPTPSDDLQKVYFNNDPNKFTYVGTSISATELKDIAAFLQEQADLFAWTPSDMPGIDPQIIIHKLAINPTVRPVQQKKRKLGDEKKKRHP